MGSVTIPLSSMRRRSNVIGSRLGLAEKLTTKSLGVAIISTTVTR